MPSAKSIIVKEVIQLIEDSGFENVRSQVDEYDSPEEIQKKNSDTSYVPDITAEKDGKTGIFDVQIQKALDENELIDKWRLFYYSARSNGSAFFVVVRDDNANYASHLLKKHDLQAKVLRIEGL